MTVPNLPNGTAVHVLGHRDDERRHQRAGRGDRDAAHDPGRADRRDGRARTTGRATVSFTPPAANGGEAVTLYTVKASTRPDGNGDASPIVVDGLTNDTPVTFTVKATNSAGTGPGVGAVRSR